MAPRILAPVSLVAAATATVVIVAGSGPSPQTSSASEASAPKVPARSQRHYWIVHTGQTLSEISGRTHVPTATLEQLNPELDLRGLRPGQRVKVR